MRALSAAELMQAWDLPSQQAAHFRLEPLLAMAAEGEDIGHDSLGRRNQRLIALRRALGAIRPIEAVARCACGVDNEATVPADAIEQAPTPAPGQRVVVEVGGRRVDARPPTMADLAVIAGIGDATAAREALLARCTDTAPEDAAPAMAALAAGFEAIDPAADIRLAVDCAGCGAPLSVAVDLALFVGRDVGQQVTALLGEVDCLARAYGWSEAEILALPPPRRHRYVALVRGDTMAQVP